MGRFWRRCAFARFEKDSTDHVPVGLKSGVDLSDAKQWKASSTLKLVGGDPGDDWSIQFARSCRLDTTQVVTTR